MPHEDKHDMEKAVFAAYPETIGDFVVVRPTLLTDGERQGVEKVRVGWEWGVEGKARNEKEKEGVAMGYSISRTDVGEWIFENVIKGSGYEGKGVTLTY